jgi:DNA-nicking Smr family endonuclease
VKTKDKLDLHGIRHHLVKQMVIGFIEARWGKGVPVEIVTGHSPEMKKIVQEVLGEYRLECQEGDFSGLNTGMITSFIN